MYCQLEMKIMNNQIWVLYLFYVIYCYNSYWSIMTFHYPAISHTHTHTKHMVGTQRNTSFTVYTQNSTEIILYFFLLGRRLEIYFSWFRGFSKHEINAIYMMSGRPRKCSSVISTYRTKWDHHLKKPFSTFKWKGSNL